MKAKTATPITLPRASTAPFPVDSADRTPTEATYAELQQAYDHLNARLFGGALPACLITLQREKNVCGYFCPGRFVSMDGRLSDEIAMNPAFFAVQPISTTLRTLAHEMTHLWQFHFGNPGRGRYHNGEWADKMESIGIMPSETGRPGGRRTGDRMDDYTMEGGAFQQACEELLTASYTLSWYDRFPARVTAGGVPESCGSITGDTTPVSNSRALASILMTPGSMTADFGGAEEGGVATSGLPRGKNRSNRTKYTCACNNNVWGKPGLQIICAVCRTLFHEPV